jgi:hypothetical protein
MGINRYVKVIRKSDSSRNPYYQVVLFSENPDEHPQLRTLKQFVLDYETGSQITASGYAHKLARCLECAVME